MSANTNMASGVEMVLLVRVLVVFISSVVVLTSPGYSIKFPLAVSLVILVSALCYLMSHNILPYVTF